VADDEFSEGEASHSVDCSSATTARSASELGQEDVAQCIESSLPAGYDVIRFFLRSYNRQLLPPPGPQLRCANRFAAISIRPPERHRESS
jgi:hypothetical protein